VHLGANEWRTVHRSAVVRLALDCNTHCPDSRANRQPFHARADDRKPHDARADDQQPHDGRADDQQPHDGRADDALSDDRDSDNSLADVPTSDCSALDDDRVPDSAAILRPELRAEPVAFC
jgi:hypothetical protein